MALGFDPEKFWKTPLRLLFLFIEAKTQADHENYKRQEELTLYAAYIAGIVACAPYQKKPISLYDILPDWKSDTVIDHPELAVAYLEDFSAQHERKSWEQWVQQLGIGKDK